MNLVRGKKDYQTVAKDVNANAGTMREDECRSSAAVKTNRVGGHHLAFKVKDLDAAVAFLKRKGVRVMAGPSSSRRAFAPA